MRISDWSSDVCSSDLWFREQAGAAADVERALARQWMARARVAVPMRVDLRADIGQAHRVQPVQHRRRPLWVPPVGGERAEMGGFVRSEEHTSELQSLMRISYAVFCLKKKKQHNTRHKITQHIHNTRHTNNT